MTDRAIRLPADSKLPNPRRAKEAVGRSESGDGIRRIAERELGAAFRLGPVRGGGDGWWCYDAWEANGTAAVSLRIQRRPGSIHPFDARFESLGQRIAELDHPHLLRLRSYGFTRQLCWLVTERIEGRSLADVLHHGGPLSLRTTLRILEQVASALDYAHRRGLVHGTLTSADIWILESDWVMVGGLGGAEAIESGTASEADDQRALARIAWRCLTGKPETDVRASDLGPLPLQVRGPIAALLADSRPARYSTVLEFVSALGAAEPEPVVEPEPAEASVGDDVLFLEARPLPWRRRLTVAGASALLLLLAVGASIAIRGPGGNASAGRAPRAPPVSPTPVTPPRSTTAIPDSVAAVPRRAGVARPLTAAAVDSVVVTPRPKPAVPTRELVRPAPKPVVPVDRRQEQRPPTAVPRAPPPSQSATPAHLFVSTRPWGTLFLDDERIANTPVADLKLAPGRHTIRITRSGFQTYEQTLHVEPGDEVRLIDLILQPVER